MGLSVFCVLHNKNTNISINSTEANGGKILNRLYNGCHIRVCILYGEHSVGYICYLAVID